MTPNFLISRLNRIIEEDARVSNYEVQVMDGEVNDPDLENFHVDHTLKKVYLMNVPIQNKLLYMVNLAGSMG